jgi:hypothetical protein
VSKELTAIVAMKLLGYDLVKDECVGASRWYARFEDDTAPRGQRLFSAFAAIRADAIEMAWQRCMESNSHLAEP